MSDHAHDTTTGTSPGSRTEHRYRQLFEDAQEAIVIASPDGEIRDANPAACRMFGYSREELMAMGAEGLHVSPEQRASVGTIIEEEGALRDAEVLMNRKDGTELTCQISSVARRDVAGNVEAYQTFIRDISETKQAQEDLLESEEKFRILAENAPIGISLLQGNTYRYVNPALAEMLEYTADELIGRSPSEVVYEGDRSTVLTNIKNRLDGRLQGVSYTFHGLTKSGTLRTLEVRGNRISYDGKPALISTFLDITDQLRLRREILHIQEEERKRFGQDLHDGVGSQLSGLTLMVARLAQRAESGENDLASDLWQIKTLLQDTNRDVRRISRGLTPLNLEETGLAHALERLVNSIGGSAETTTEIEAEDEIPELSDEMAVHLYWMAQEAVSNAHQHANADRVKLSLATTNGNLVLEISDDGRGLLQDRSAGGMGLNTLRYRAELIGGRLDIHTSPDTGTSVRCVVPLSTG